MEFRPSSGQAIADFFDIAKRKASPIPANLTMLLEPTRVYEVPVHTAYRVAMMLDNTVGFSIRPTVSVNVSADRPTLKIKPVDTQGQPVVLLGSGRVGPASAVEIADTILDGSDAEMTDESKQQSTLFRAFAISGLKMRNVALNNIAADGIKLAGSAAFGPTTDVRLTDCTSEDTGRAAVVFQSLVSDVVIDNLTTRRQRKGAIDVEATIEGQPAPSNIKILSSNLSCKKADGTFPAFGVSLGAGTGIGRNILVANVTTDAGVLVHSCDVELHNVRAVGLEAGLVVRKRGKVRICDSWFSGVADAGMIVTHHNVRSDLPEVVAVRTEFTSIGGTSAVKLRGVGATTFLDCTYRNLKTGIAEMYIVNELSGVDMPGPRIRMLEGRTLPVRVDRRNWSNLGAPVWLS